MRAKLEIDRSLARLTLLDGDGGNPLDLDTLAELKLAVSKIKGQHGLSALLLCSRGKNFCFGGNFKTMGVKSDLDRYIRQVTVEFHDWLQELLRIPMPIFSAVQGGVAGAGIALALFADYVIASDDAHFTLSFAKLGATPDGGTTFLLPKLIGIRRFQELLITNRRVNASEALAFGMVSEVCKSSDFAVRVEEVLAQAQQLEPGAIAETRALLLQSFSNNLEAQLNLESRTLSERCNSAEMISALNRAING